MDSEVTRPGEGAEQLELGGGPRFELEDTVGPKQRRGDHHGCAQLSRVTAASSAPGTAAGRASSMAVLLLSARSPAPSWPSFRW